MAELDTSWLSPLSNIVGIVGGLILLYVGMMRFFPPVQSFLIMRPRPGAGRGERGSTSRPGAI